RATSSSWWARSRSARASGETRTAGSPVYIIGGNRYTVTTVRAELLPSAARAAHCTADRAGSEPSKPTRTPNSRSAEAKGTVSVMTGTLPLHDHDDLLGTIITAHWALLSSPRETEPSSKIGRASCRDGGPRA